MRPQRAGEGREPLDHDVRHRAATELNASVILEAGAGTGKTTVLVSRVMSILRTDVPLESVALITFTEKAAGELKQKIRAEIERELAVAHMTPSWQRVLRESLESLDRATICTIHAFAASMLRERPVEAQIDPRFTTADALQATMLREETWERWIEEQTAARPAPLARALRRGLKLSQLRDLAFALLAHREIRIQPGPQSDMGSLEAVRRSVPGALEQLDALCASCIDRADRMCTQIRELHAHVERLRTASGEALLGILTELPLSASLGNQQHWSPPGDLARVRETIRKLAAQRDEACRGVRTALAHELGAWLRAGFNAHYRQAKESRRLLDFEDLLIICRNMLRDAAPARESFQRRWRCLLVDEFQDTDPLQAEIIFLLASGDPAQSDWRLTRPAPGKLFVVGDPKQSIYRFRRADIEVYEEVRALVMRSGGVSETLTQNFRTVPSIVSWVNDLFKELIRPVEQTRMQPRYIPIEAYRFEPRHPAGPAAAEPRVLLMPPASPQALRAMSADQARREESAATAALIAAALKEEWRVVDPETGQPRTIRPADIALLFRTSTAMEIYEETLRRAGIPYQLSGGRRYYQRAELQALQAVILAIASPHDPLAVVSALRSPFFGCSDEELLAHAVSGDWVYTREAAGAGTPMDKPFELLRRLHAERLSRPAAATLEDLYEATGALSLFYLKPDGDQRAANLIKALDLARVHEATEAASFSTFARWLARMAAQEYEEAEAPLNEEAPERGDEDGAVQMMTVHAAKGLEYPVVILCDPGGRPRARAPLAIVERAPAPDAAARLEFAIGADDLQHATSGYEAARGREKLRLEAEAQRLFYVAATRARDYLVIPTFATSQSRGFLASMGATGFLPAAGGGAEHRGAVVLQPEAFGRLPQPAEPFRLSLADVPQADVSLSVEKGGWRRALVALLGSPATGRSFRSPSGEADSRRKDRATPVTARPAGSRRARALGLAVHAVLEKIDLATGADMGVMCEEESERAGYPDLAAEARALVERALSSRLIKEALAAPRYFRELPFAAAGDSWITEGRVDLAWESGGGLIVVDFKTDRVDSEADLAAHVDTYMPQAALYAVGLQQATGRPVREVVFHFLRTGADRPIKVTDGLLSLGRQILEGGQAKGVA